ncbi:MAG: hypothetical protein JO345_25695 [Streptosporangiaceae bacterium]|nr:hypothetical protein [Streptosporangiaceae bacterium]
MFRSSRKSPRVRLAAIAVGAGLLTAVGLTATAGPASADTVLNVHYDLTGTAFINKANTTVNLGAGTLSSAVDLNNGALISTLSLPPGTISFRTSKGLLVTVTTAIIQNSPASGAINLNTGTITSTANVTLKVTHVTAAGSSVQVGSNCKTSPFNIDITSGKGFSIITGGPLEGTFTIPSFGDCEFGTQLLNINISGPGNTLNLALGGVQLG